MWQIAIAALVFGVCKLPPVARLIEKNKYEKKSKWQNQYALACRRCQDLAYPIDGTYNRYRCACGNQFSGSKHSGINGNF